MSQNEDFKRHHIGLYVLFIYFHAYVNIYHNLSITSHKSFMLYVTVYNLSCYHYFTLLKVTHDLGKTEAPFWGGVEVACCTLL